MLGGRAVWCDGVGEEMGRPYVEAHAYAALKGNFEIILKD